MDAQTDPLLLQTALETARKLGLVAEHVAVAREPAPGQADTLVNLGRAGHLHTYAVEIKRGLRPGTLGAVIHRLERLQQPALLITDYVTPPMAALLRERGIPFFDAAGNAWLQQPGVLVWVVGNKPPAPLVPPAFGRAFQPTGLQVVFALLCDPQAINLPYRELAARAGVAHGTVGWVIPDLQEQGFVLAMKTRRVRRLDRTERLLAQWVDAYARVLRPRTLLARYYAATLANWREWNIEEHGGIWGGEPAAALLTNYLRPGELTVYADRTPGLLAARQRLLGKPEPGHLAVVDVRRRFWRFTTPGLRADVTPPVLVYADLLATGEGRCIETAGMIFEAHLAGLVDPR